MHNSKPQLDARQSLDRLRGLLDPAERENLQSDAELLEMYVGGGSREALETIVRRYGPLVASVCRLTAHDAASAEDAFQATFLVFIKSAKRIRKSSSLSAWLHGVAYRTACRARLSHRRSLTNVSDEHMVSQSSAAEEPIAQIARRMELEALDRELHSLPHRLRDPLIEHYLMGFSAPQIAERMELSVSAVEGRLRRGRRLLRTRLAQRGISLSILVAAAPWFQQHLQAAEAGQWTSHFLQQLSGAGAGATEAGATDTGAQHLAQQDLFNIAPNATLSSEVLSLVEGELSMLTLGASKGLLAVAATALVGVSLALAIDPPQQGNQGANATSFNARADFTQPSVLAQFGGNPQQPSQNQNQNQGNPNPANNTNQDQNSNANGPAAGGGAGEGGYDPGYAGGMGWGPATPQRVGPPPAWLSLGESTIQAVEANRAVLSKQIEAVDFQETPLSTLAEWLSENTAVDFSISSEELDLLGIDKDTPISISGKGCSVRELLRRVLTPLELTYVVHESTIEITSVDAAEDEFTVRFYDLSAVADSNAQVQMLLNAIQQSIDSDSWLQNGGNQVAYPIGATIAITATERTHHQVEVFLASFAKVKANAFIFRDEIPSPKYPGMGGYGGEGMGGMGGGAAGMGGMGGGYGGMGGMGGGGGGMF